jgi:hypothetical protein
VIDLTGKRSYPEPSLIVRMRSKVSRPFGELFSLPKGASEAAMERIDAILALDQILGGLIEPNLEPATTFEPERD